MRRLALLVLAVVSLSSGMVVGTGAATATTDETPRSTTSEPPPAPDIIPRPDEGAEPDEPGDRGGALQTVVFLVIVGGLVVIGTIVVRQSRRARAGRGF